MKSKGIAYLLWLLSVFGWLGLHRFYLGKKWTGLLWLCTGGIVGIGSIIDLFSLGDQVKQINNMLILDKLSKGEEIANFKKYLKDFKDNHTEPGISCPYCLGNISRMPKQDFKCPYCSKVIYFRPDQKIFDTALLKKEDAIIADYLQEFTKFGMNEPDFIARREELLQKYGVEINALDIFWSLYKELLDTTTDIRTLKKLRKNLDLLLNEVGKDSFYILQRVAKMQLLEIKKDGYTKQVRIKNYGEDTCETCRELSGKVFPIDHALKKLPVPCRECSYQFSKGITGFCRCSYEAVNRSGEELEL